MRCPPLIYLKTRNKTFIKQSNMVLSLQELSLLNMSLRQIKYPYTHQRRNGYLLENIIFQCGKRIIVNELRVRDAFIDRNWHGMQNHHCLLEDSDSKCWCACDIQKNFCICLCFNSFYMILTRFEEENGPINDNVKFKWILSGPV